MGNIATNGPKHDEFKRVILDRSSLALRMQGCVSGSIYFIPEHLNVETINVVSGRIRFLEKK